MQREMVRDWLLLLRLQHWVKNGLLLLPAIFGGITGIEMWGRLGLGVVTFGILSSAVYLINDIVDAPLDRKDARKKDRPIARGAIKPSHAAAVAMGLLTAAMISGVWGLKEMSCVAILGGYLLLNLTYSLFLKHHPLVDVSVLAAFYLLRIYFGAAIVSVEVSNWLFLTVVSMSFAVSFLKRRNELRASGAAGRKVLAAYTEPYLDKAAAICVTLTIVFYALWTIDANTAAAQNGINLVATVPVVLLLLFRYLMVADRLTQDNPVDILLQDKTLLTLAVAYLGLLAAAVYG